jgi:hypothetical protein
MSAKSHIGRDLERYPLQILLATLLQRDGEKPGLAGQEGAAFILGVEYQPVDVGVIGDRSVEIRRLERSMSDPA